MTYIIGMENKKENFKRIAENRTNRIVDAIASLKNLTNTSYYEYTDEEIESIFRAIQEELDRTHEAFERQKGKIKRFKL